MRHGSESSEEDRGAALWHATKALQDVAEALGRTSFLPFAGPSGEDADWQAWQDAEEESRDRCDRAIAEWLECGVLPLLGDHEAYFLGLRFRLAAEFLRKLYLPDGSSVFGHDGLSLQDVVWWMLVDWWEEHGATEAWLDAMARHGG